MIPSSALANPALMYAALSGPFAPQQALQQLNLTDGARQLAMAASLLADACDIQPAGSSNRWLMRTPVRHALLSSLGSDQLAVEVAARQTFDPDPETADLLGALLNQAPLQREAIKAILQAPGDPVQLERVILALDRAGVLAPACDLLPQARSALAEWQRRRMRQQVLERGFFGRDAQLHQIRRWLAQPSRSQPVGCLFITGAPGIGKSSLLAEAVRRCYEDHRPLTLRLDFDRAGLDVRDQLGLTQEAARQLAEQLGEAGGALLQARLAATVLGERTTRSNMDLRQQIPLELVNMIGSAVTASGRSMLVVLDTLEVLRGRGETHIPSLFNWLDELAGHGACPMAVLAAGRGDALDGVREQFPLPGGTTASGARARRQIEILIVPGLEVQAASALLTRLQIAEPEQSALLAIADGSPLKLRLAAEIVQRTGLDHLPKRAQGKEVSAAFLYRLLLSRIDDPGLRRLAHPGLIVRRINAEVIQQVLAPALGLKKPTPQRAEALLDQLASHHWLVEADPGAAGFLKHRSDMRQLLLPLLYQSAPRESAKVDAAAIRWFGARSESWAQVEAAYHQLQLTRSGRAAPTISSQLAAQFDADTLNELPARAADMVRRKLGQRTSQFRSGAPSWDLQRDDSALAEELLSLVEKQDWQEGAFIVRNLVAEGALDPRSAAADGIRTFLWRSGQWAEARRWLNARDRFDSSDADLPHLPEPVGMARLEMRAEFSPELLRRERKNWLPFFRQHYQPRQNMLGSVPLQGALALLVRSLAEVQQAALTSSRADDHVDDAAVAALARWAGMADSVAVERTLEQAKRRFAGAGMVDVQETNDMPFGSLLAPLTPYAGFLTTYRITRQRTDLRDWARTAMTVITRQGQQLSPHLRFDRLRDTDPVLWLADIGLFAEWLQATAFIHHDADLTLIGRYAERWRRTVAGNWSIGPRRGQWRDHGALDDTLSERLRLLSEAPDPRHAALQQINTWGAALSTDSLRKLLQRRLPGAFREARSAWSRETPLDLITRRLLTHGAPAAVAPALAMLMAHRAI